MLAFTLLQLQLKFADAPFEFVDAPHVWRSETKGSREMAQAEGTGHGHGLVFGIGVLLQCLFDRFGSVFPQCGLMVFPGVVIVSR